VCLGQLNVMACAALVQEPGTKFSTMPSTLLGALFNLCMAHGRCHFNRSFLLEVDKGRVGVEVPLPFANLTLRRLPEILHAMGKANRSRVSRTVCPVSCSKSPKDSLATWVCALTPK
jgi:hypothetical protein